MSFSHSTNTRGTMAAVGAVIFGATLSNSPENRFVRSPSPGHSDDDISSQDTQENPTPYKYAFDKKIQRFYKNNPERFRRPLEKIINKCLLSCKYRNGESLERHNWGDKPLKLTNMPTSLNSSPELFEKELLEALGKSDNDTPIIELLLGDPQLGKRIHACIIMWISIFILKRPVLYIFRNIKIDQQQLQSDIIGSDNSSFAHQYIKQIFDEFVDELEDEDEWKSYRLPELKFMSDEAVLNKFADKNALRSDDILCCLGNYVQLDRINNKLNEYVYNHKQLLNITLLIDEGDLISPTASNDGTHKNDLRDTTLCEKAISKIIQKVRYVLYITGTGYSLLNNNTTKVNEELSILTKVSQIHIMVHGPTYYGIMNRRITFITDMVDPFFEKTKYNLLEKTKYNLHEDYVKNIRPIITEITRREALPDPAPYTSLLLSENKLRLDHLETLEKILRDFPDRFVIVFNGMLLRLYLSKDYDSNLKELCIWDSQQSAAGRRLNDDGGIYGPPKSLDSNNNILPNNYCYYEINTKSKFNLKQIYKLLRILFEKSEIHVKHKMVITITGRYADRGYSFTSDNYDEFSMHLTDQYLTSHASINCVDILQRTRIQGKYNDNMKITLWTTNQIQNLMQSFYVPFMEVLTENIMDCKSCEEIKEHIESIIDYGDLHFRKYMKYLDIKKKMKNQETVKRFDPKTKGFKLFPIAGKTDDELSDCIAKQTNLPPYTRCINTIKTDLTEVQFIEKYGVYDIEQKDAPIGDISTYDNLLKEIQKHNGLLNPKGQPLPGKNWLKDRQDRKKEQNSDYYVDRMTVKDWDKKNIQDYRDNKLRNMQNKIENHLWNLAYDSNNQLYISLRYTTVKIMPKHSSSDYIKGTPFRMENGSVRYSVLNDGINIDSLPEKYYFRSVDGWLYLHDSTKTENSMFSLEIRAPPAPVIPVIVSPTTEIVADPVPVEPVINHVLIFTQKHFQPTENTRLRVGIKDVYEVYKPWCNSQNITPLLRTKLQEELTALQYTYCTKKGEEKGVDMRGAPGKRGYNIMLLPITI